MKHLTDKQKEVAAFIASFIKEKKYPPSVRDVAAGFGFSVKSAHDHLKALEKKGVIRTTTGVSRSIELTDDRFVTEGTVCRVRVLSEPESVCELPAGLLPEEANHLFALRIPNDALKEDGIKAGDLAVFRTGWKVEKGDHAAVRLSDDEPLRVCRCRPDKDGVELRTGDESVVVPSRTVRGRLVLLIRTY